MSSFIGFSRPLVFPCKRQTIVTFTPSRTLLERARRGALASALRSSGRPQQDGIRDALSFRAKCRQIYPYAASAERLLEMNEGLAEYTAIVTVSSYASQAGSVVIDELHEFERKDSS
jgi:hypothetical protein